MKRRGPLDFVFFPILTHVPSWLGATMDTASCPIVAGTPDVVKAAFTKEVDFFARAGVEYLDPALSFTEPNLLKRRMFETWGSRLGVTEDESDFAIDEGFAALAAFTERIEAQGRAILEQVEREDRVAILVVGRPYHHDAGLHHGIPEEFQVLGYPILSIRSLPKDPAWWRRFFGDADPMDIRDVWPENYSANSSQKVWAVRAAARHPNLALLDLSSFKCGHDAPTYGIVDAIVKTAKVPYAALHDLDANKPGGSIRIRVKTYAHKLKLVEEELADRALARAEHARRVAEKRAALKRELIAARAIAK
jgi:predicted nucleotide-binding protein (sugar kinase/HSP70/actin superfamily)